MTPLDSQKGEAPPLAQDRPLRLGAVSYLNTKPLVYGLEAQPDQFDVRFDVPSKCAALLHAGAGRDMQRELADAVKALIETPPGNPDR